MPLGFLVLKPMDTYNYKVFFSIALVTLVALVLYSFNISNYVVFSSIALIAVVLVI